MPSIEFISRSPTQTKAFGQCLAGLLQAGDVVVLAGDLGAGKTCLAQGICLGAGVTDPVNSPTFTLIHEYQGRFPVFHLDAYRLTDPSEADELGLEEVLGGEGIAVVEWAERISDYLPDDLLRVELEGVSGADASTRRLRITGRGARGGRLAEELARRCAF